MAKDVFLTCNSFNTIMREQNFPAALFPQPGCGNRAGCIKSVYSPDVVFVCSIFLFVCAIGDCTHMCVVCVCMLFSMFVCLLVVLVACVCVLCLCMLV